MHFIFLGLIFISFINADTIELDAIDVNGSGGVTQNINEEYSEGIIKSETFLPSAPMQKQLTTKEALRVAGTNGDPIKAIQSFAGIVTTSNDRANDIYVHGSKPRETTYNINQLPLGYVFHLGGLHSVISPEATGQIDAYLGGFDVTYQAMGAVVDITPKYPTGSNSGRVHLGLYDSDFALDVKLGENTNLFLGGRRSYFDFIANEVLDGTLTEDDNDKSKKVTFTVFPQFYDLQMILSHTIGNSAFSIEAIHSKDRLKINTTLNKGKDPVANGKINTNVGFTTVGFRWNYFKDNFNSMTLLSYIDNKLDLDLFDVDYFVKVDNKKTKLYHQTVFTNIENHKPLIGVELENNKTPLDIYATSKPSSDDFKELVTDQTPVRLKKTYNAQNYTLFAQDIWDINENNHFRYGFRGWKTDFQEFGWGIDPRFAFVHDFSSKLSLSFAIGKYSQFPDDTYVIDGYGNPSIDTSEHSIHYTLNMTKKFDDKSKLTFEPYFKTFDNLAIRDDLENYKAVGTGKAYGVDLTYQKSLEKFNLILAYTFVKAQRELFSNDNKEYRFEGDIPHTVQLNTEYRFDNGWYISSLFRFNSGRPYTPIVGTEEFIYDGETYKRPIYGEPYSKRMPSIMDWDIQVGKKYKYTNSSLELAFELMNISSFFKDSVVAYSYDDDYNIDGEVQNLGFLPAIHLTYRF